MSGQQGLRAPSTRRFTIRWDVDMGMYRVSEPGLGGPLAVVPAADYDAAIGCLRDLHAAAGAVEPVVAVHAASTVAHGELLDRMEDAATVIRAAALEGGSDVG